jgi:hypothetical protein
MIYTLNMSLSNPIIEASPGASVDDTTRMLRASQARTSSEADPAARPGESKVFGTIDSSGRSMCLAGWVAVALLKSSRRRMVCPGQLEEGSLSLDGRRIRWRETVGGKSSGMTNDVNGELRGKLWQIIAFFWSWGTGEGPPMASNIADVRKKYRWRASLGQRVLARR